MKQRLISAIIALIIFIPPLILGGIYFKLAMTLLSLLSVYEILKLKQIPKIIKIISYLLIIIMVLSNINLIEKILLVIFSFLIFLPFCDNDKYNIEVATYIISFIIILGLVFSLLCEIRKMDINVLLYLILISTLTDTFAYIIGSLFGKHKIIENVSANKTIEGTVSGTIIATLFSSIFYIYMINPGANILLIILMTYILSLISQIGDFVFSSIKRFYKIKDFSNIMPGHGGVLDRLDSTIFVVIAYMIIINLI